MNVLPENKRQPKNTIFYPLLAILLMSTASISAYAEENFSGPLNVRDQFLLGMALLAFEPDTARPSITSDTSFELFQTVSNTFAHSAIITSSLVSRINREALDLDFFRSITPGENLFLLDGQVQHNSFSVKHQLYPETQIALKLQWLGLRGGNLDAFIEKFHDIVETGQHGRTGVPRDEFLVYVRSGDTEYFENIAPGEGIGDIVFSIKHDIYEIEKKFYVAIEPSIKFPSGDDNTLFSSGSIDTGLQVLITRVLKGANLYISLGVLYLGKWELLGLPNQAVISGAISYEHELTSQSSVVSQLTFSESPLGKLDIPELSDYSFQASLGYKFQITRNHGLVLAFTENLVHFDNSADIGIHLGYSYHF